MEFRDEGKRFIGAYDENYEVAALGYGVESQVYNVETGTYAVETNVYAVDAPAAVFTGDLTVQGTIIGGGGAAPLPTVYQCSYSVSTRPVGDLDLSQPTPDPTLFGRLIDADLTWPGHTEIPPAFFGNGVALSSGVGSFEIRAPGKYSFTANLAMDAAPVGEAGFFVLTDNWLGNPVPGIPLIASCTERAAGIKCESQHFIINAIDDVSQTFPIVITVFAFGPGGGSSNILIPVQTDPGTPNYENELYFTLFQVTAQVVDP